MKRRRIVLTSPQPKLRVFTETESADYWDVDTRNPVTKEHIEAAFNAATNRHQEFILRLATSRLALGGALTTVSEAINSVTNNAVELTTPSDTAAIDQAYSTGLRLYAYSHVLGFIPDAEVRKELLKALAVAALQTRPNVATPANGERSTGSLRTASGAQTKDPLEATIKKLERRLTKSLGPAQDEQRPRKREARFKRRPQ